MIFGFCPQCDAVIQSDGSGHFPHCPIIVGLVSGVIREIEVSVPTDSDFWGTITATAVKRMRAPKTPPKPHDNIVSLAQASWDGVIDPQNPDGEKLHVLEFNFGTDTQRAAKFAADLKKAGDHTSPPTTVRVLIDPERKDGEPPVEPGLVRWSAGAKRTRKVSS